MLSMTMRNFIAINANRSDATSAADGCVRVSIFQNFIFHCEQD
jgi:hypothetical protein